MAFLQKLLERNDDADPQFVLPLLVLSLFMGVILTGTAVVLVATAGNPVALIIISVLAVVCWLSLALIMRKYSRISM